MSLSDLQIGLAVQISGLYEGHTLRLRRRQHDQVGGEESVVMNLYILKKAILAIRRTPIDYYQTNNPDKNGKQP